jgi:hypothetical protein
MQRVQRARMVQKAPKMKMELLESRRAVAPSLKRGKERGCVFAEGAGNEQRTTACSCTSGAVCGEWHPRIEATEAV